ncbi:MAG: type III pantothenate kinase [Planctomycetota bacterium]|nr:type III pantothenate kinase [Planctomycetota bacterium]
MAITSDNTWLAVDVGNSRIKFGLFQSGLFTTPTGNRTVEPTCPPALDNAAMTDSLVDTALPGCVRFYSQSLHDLIAWDSICDAEHATNELRCVIVGSNQRGVDRIVNAWPQWLSSPLVIRSSESFPIRIQVDEPRRVGLDRLLNAVAADAVRDDGSHAIIVDCGTATTVDLVSASSGFCGGAILPGFTLCARALNEYTEVLPLISMDELFDLPVSEDSHPALGRNTQAAIMSGVFWGQIGAVRELIDRLRRLTQAMDSGEGRTTVLLTGGGSRLLVPYFADAIHCPFLPLQGLVLAAASHPKS